MKRDIRTTLAIDGEREFKKALSEAGRQMSVLASESKAVTAAFGNNQNSTEALTAKNKILIKQIKQQEEIFDALSGAVGESAEKYGEADKKTDGYRIKMNNAAASLEKMKATLKKNESALEQMADAEEDAGKEADKMGKQLKGAGNDTKGAGNQIKDFASSSVAQFASIAGAAALFEKALEKAWQTISESAKWAKELTNVSQTAGFAKDTYQQWDYILRDFDYSMEESSGDLAALAEKAMDAAAGAGEGAELFEKMGIKVIDNNGILKTQEQLFEETIVALQAMNDVTERNAIASALMSTTGEKLIPVLNMTADEVDGLKKEADEMGVVLGEGTVAQLKLLQDEFDTTDAVMESFKKRMAARTAETTRELNKLWQETLTVVNNIERRVSETPSGITLEVEALFKTNEELDAIEEKTMLINAAMEIWSATEEEVTQKQQELAQVLINDGIPAAEATSQAWLLLADGTDAQAHAVERMAAAQAEWDQKATTAAENYVALAEEYTAAIESTTNTYLSSMGGLFGEFDAELASSQKALDEQSQSLLDNLDSQVDGLEGWADSIERLSKRSIDEGLLQELRDMGPDAYAEIEALNNMTDDQLEEYQGLYKTRSELAEQAAIDALEPMAQDVQDALGEVEKVIEDENDAMEELGKQLAYGIGDGIDSGTWYVEKEVKKAVDAAISAARNYADINSPSGLTRDEVGFDLGRGVGVGWVEGIDKMMPDVESKLLSSVNSLSTAMTPPVNAKSVYTKETIRDTGLALHINGPVNIHNDDDIEKIANKLGRYYQQQRAANGGVG